MRFSSKPHPSRTPQLSTKEQIAAHYDCTTICTAIVASVHVLQLERKVLRLRDYDSNAWGHGDICRLSARAIRFSSDTPYDILSEPKHVCMMDAWILVYGETQRERWPPFACKYYSKALTRVDHSWRCACKYRSFPLLLMQQGREVIELHCCSISDDTKPRITRVATNYGASTKPVGFAQTWGAIWQDHHS